MVPAWESPSIISSHAIKGFDLTIEVNGSGHAYIVTELVGSANSSSLECYVQDLSSTNWTKSSIATVDYDKPEILRRNVFYIEMTVRKGDTAAPGKRSPR